MLADIAVRLAVIWLRRRAKAFACVMIKYIKISFTLCKFGFPVRIYHAAVSLQRLRYFGLVAIVEQVVCPFRRGIGRVYLKNAAAAGEIPHFIA